MCLKLLTVQLLWFYSNDFPSDELLLLRAEWSVCVDTCRVSESAADYQWGGFRVVFTDRDSLSHFEFTTHSLWHTVGRGSAPLDYFTVKTFAHLACICHVKLLYIMTSCCVNHIQTPKKIQKQLVRLVFQPHIYIEHMESTTSWGDRSQDIDHDLVRKMKHFEAVAWISDHSLSGTL